MFITTAEDKLYVNTPGVAFDNIESLKTVAGNIDFTWAEDLITDHDGLLWVLANYVEAGRPNKNGHMWTFEDLLEAQHTIKHMPMNVLHNSKNVVGSWVDQNMIYPLEAEGVGHPYIEVLGALWAKENPAVAELVVKYYSEGSLFVSMECVAETVTIFADDQKETYPYQGPRHESYGAIQNVPGAAFQLNKPTFVGGALIFPPASPGWSGANVTSIAREIIGEESVDEILAGVKASMGEDSDDDRVEDVAADFIMKRFVAVASIVNADEIVEVAPLINDSNDPMNDTKEEIDDPQGGVDVMNELETANATIAELTAQVEELNASLNAKATESVISELEESHAVALEEKLTELAAVKAELDVATAKAEASEAQYAELVAFLESEVAAAEQAAVAEARIEERVAAIKSVASVSDEYVAKRQTEWSELSDEAFASLVDDLKAVAVAKPEGESGDEGLPKSTAMQSGDSGSDENKTSFDKTFDLIRSGADLKNIR